MTIKINIFAGPEVTINTQKPFEPHNHLAYWRGRHFIVKERGFLTHLWHKITSFFHFNPHENSLRRSCRKVMGDSALDRTVRRQAAYILLAYPKDSSLASKTLRTIEQEELLCGTDDSSKLQAAKFLWKKESPQEWKILAAAYLLNNSDDDLQSLALIIYLCQNLETMDTEDFLQHFEEEQQQTVEELFEKSMEAPPFWGKSDTPKLFLESSTFAKLESYWPTDLEPKQRKDLEETLEDFHEIALQNLNS
ncbi:MAG: hypothetical protein ACQEP8_01200 [Chlamydiota bacterium]